jgi:hypothetical protein
VVWELIFMMLILKIPIVYLCWVVWWAIRSEPRPLEGATLVAVDDDIDPRPPWRRRLRGSPTRRGGPHGSPRRAPALRGRSAPMRAERDR